MFYCIMKQKFICYLSIKNGNKNFRVGNKKRVDWVSKDAGIFLTTLRRRLAQLYLISSPLEP